MKLTFLEYIKITFTDMPWTDDEIIEKLCPGDAIINCPFLIDRELIESSDHFFKDKAICTKCWNRIYYDNEK